MSGVARRTARGARALLRTLALVAGFASVTGLLPKTATAQSPCRQALALGLDVSGSVDAREYRLQLDGLAAALEDPQVQAAFFAMPGAPVRLMVFEWSARAHQRPLVAWQEIPSAKALATIAARLRATRPVAVPNPSTAIGAAMIFGAQELHAQEGCWQKTLDISGDGPANIGRHPRDVPDDITAGLTINGLVIGPDGPANTSKNRANLKSLLGYYEAYVLRGPGAFVETADSFEDFAAAMRRKLIRELQPVNLSDLAPGGADAPMAANTGARDQ
jgi:hypothetical protein